MLNSVQEELHKEKSDRNNERDSLQSEISQLVKDRDDKDKNIKELNDNLALKETEILELKSRVEEVCPYVVVIRPLSPNLFLAVPPWLQYNESNSPLLSLK